VLSKIAVDIPTPVRPNARLASCIVYKNDIVSFGVNEMKSHPFQARYCKNDNAVYLHAETCAIKNALKEITVDELESATLYVARVKMCDRQKGNIVFGLSKPCSGCAHCIKTFKLQKTVYTLDNTGFELL
jgi:pyrimidine deaminase RibD-like protein